MTARARLHSALDAIERSLSEVRDLRNDRDLGDAYSPALTLAEAELVAARRRLRNVEAFLRAEGAGA